MKFRAFKSLVLLLAFVLFSVGLAAQQSKTAERITFNKVNQANAPASRNDQGANAPADDKPVLIDRSRRGQNRADQPTRPTCDEGTTANGRRTKGKKKGKKARQDQNRQRNGASCATNGRKETGSRNWRKANHPGRGKALGRGKAKGKAECAPGCQGSKANLKKADWR